MTDEQRLLLRVLDALLREDHLGLRSRGTVAPHQTPAAGLWLRTALPGGDGAILLPVRRGGFLADHTVRLPLVVVRDAAGDRVLTGLDEVLDALSPRGDAEAEQGFTHFRAECRDALAATRLHAAHAPAAPSTADLRGVAGAVAYDALAATLDHPVYPTSRARTGLTSEDLRRYAPELRPTFALRWVALPVTALTVSGGLPSWWPTCEALGLPASLDATHLTVPVHPLTVAGPLDDALDETGLADDAHPAPRPYADVTPTLSMRTVALADEPTTHVKVPMPTSTLGLRNRRSLKPGTFADGATTQWLLAEVLRREPRLRESVLQADETTWVHAGHEYLGALVRRYPTGLDGARVVPVAALAARLPDGRLVAQELAEAFFGGDVTVLLEAYLGLLLDWNLTLWLRYGVALEAHQQNVALVLDHGPSGQPRLRLLLKDNDGPRVDPTLVADALGGDASLLEGYDDARVLVHDPGALADVVTTITLHLCAAAVVDRLATEGALPYGTGMRLVREALEQATTRHPGARDLPVLRERVLDAERLPLKAMLTAGTLLPKDRTGAVDVNKFYAGSAPSYLRAGYLRAGYLRAGAGRAG